MDLVLLVATTTRAAALLREEIHREFRGRSHILVEHADGRFADLRADITGVATGEVNHPGHVVTGVRIWHGPRARLCYRSVDMAAGRDRPAKLRLTVFR